MESCNAKKKKNLDADAAKYAITDMFASGAAAVAVPTIMQQQVKGGEVAMATVRERSRHTTWKPRSRVKQGDCWEVVCIPCHEDNYECPLL